MRKPLEGYVSYERLFTDIRNALPKDIEVELVHSWFHSRGIFGRLLNCIQAFFLKADVIHVTGDIHYLVPVLFRRRSILTIHDLAPLRPKSGWKRRIFQYLWYTLPVRCATCTTVITEAIREEVLALFPNEKIEVKVIHNCISEEFTPIPRDWPEVPVILMVGTLVQKNVERMCSALEAMPVSVRIVGCLSEDQQGVLDSLNLHYEVLGRITDEALIQAYRDCDVLAFASQYEGFGIPIIEAQATGRPVLTSDVPALVEVAGEGALFVDPMSVDSISVGFSRLLYDGDLRQHLVNEGFNNIRRFTAQAVASRYAKIYRAC
ncbi:MAG: glycosyltransferase family 4 protein [Opitutaceae bacterium]